MSWLYDCQALLLSSTANTVEAVMNSTRLETTMSQMRQNSEPKSCNFSLEPGMSSLSWKY